MRAPGLALLPLTRPILPLPEPWIGCVCAGDDGKREARKTVIYSRPQKVPPSPRIETKVTGREIRGVNPCRPEPNTPVLTAPRLAGQPTDYRFDTCGRARPSPSPDRSSNLRRPVERPAWWLRSKPPLCLALACHALRSCAKLRQTASAGRAPRARHT